MEFFGPRNCLYDKNNLDANPHSKPTISTQQKINPNILHAIGHTPLVRLNRIPQSLGIKCEILAKCEFKNPGGSLKDRIVLAIVEDAERRGLLKPGFTIIEPTSGNTGIALAMVSAVKGYNCILCIPGKVSKEKEDILKSLGSKVVRTPDTNYDHPDGVFVVAQKLQETTPNSIILGQFYSSANPLSHYYGTAMEIFDQCEGKIDMMVMGIGSGGSITGIGRRLKELIADCLVVGIDPVGSQIALPEELNKTDITFVEVEGMGHNFYPPTLDKSVVDFWLKVDDKTSFSTARKLHKEEGLLCGSSSGCIMAGALKAAASLKEGQKCVVILPDGASNYLSKFVSDYWMEAKEFIPSVNTLNHWWWEIKVSELSLKPFSFVTPTSTCGETSKIMKCGRHDMLPCVHEDKSLEGIVNARDLISKLVISAVQFNDPISKVVSQNYRKVTLNSSLGELSRILERESVAVIVAEDVQLMSNTSNYKLKGLIFAADLLDYLSNTNQPVIN